MRRFKLALPIVLCALVRRALPSVSPRARGRHSSARRDRLVLLGYTGSITMAKPTPRPNFDADPNRGDQKGRIKKGGLAIYLPVPERPKRKFRLHSYSPFYGGRLEVLYG
jgi:hypothetical protein